MTGTRQNSVFGKRRHPHTVIIARGDEIRHFTVRPWIAAVIGSTVAAMAIGYLLATSYLVIRDDLIGSSIARQARMQQAYEDRISSLRAQVDRITSRQLLDQQLMENKVSELISRQSQLTSRHGRLGPILERAGVATDGLPTKAPLPDVKPDRRAGLALGSVATANLAGSIGLPWDSPSGSPLDTPADRADQLFLAINTSLRTIESEQIDSIRTLTENAFETAEAISDALADAGLAIDASYGTSGTGGPLLPLQAEPQSSEFEQRVTELDQALSHLEKVKLQARRLPIANPSEGSPISSRFGVRRDPLLGTPAMHAGMDFRAKTGTPIKATAPGKVVFAGRNGGYGRMVEIRHADGLSTRFAHMSRVDVVVGEKVKIGDVVGLVGSTGRSTGPHLHYEIRADGKPVDPLKFLRAGRKVAGLL